MKHDSDRLEPLTSILESNSIKNDPETLFAHAVDGVRPWAVVFPESLEQVSDVVKLAQEERWALLPWGSGSKIGVGNAPSRLDLVISMARYSKIIDMDTANLTVTAQAGIRFKALQSTLAGEENRCYLPYETPTMVSDELMCSSREHMGCFIPMMPPYTDTATLGGIIAANSSGPTRLLYGLPRDMVLGVRYVAPDGEMIGMGGKTVKNVSGYDMCKLMIGSRGTLGVLGEMTLRLLPLPQRLGTCISKFSGLSEASDFVDRILESTLLPSAIELMRWRTSGPLTPDIAPEMDGKGYAVAVALEGFEEAVGRMASDFQQMASASGARGNAYLHDDGHRIFWDVHCNLVSKLSAQYEQMVTIRLNYPISRYVAVIRLAESLSSACDMEYILQAHAGSGVCLIHFLLGPEDLKAGDQMVTLAERLLDYCQGIGGNLVVERAPARLKRRLPVWGAPRGDLRIMKRIKEQMDPYGIFCPGRFVGGI